MLYSSPPTGVESRLWALLDQARSALREFVQSDALDAAAAAAFGPRVSGSAVAAQVLSFDRYGWPGAVVVDEHALHGARGAYDQARDTIYVSRVLLADPRASSTDVIAVLIEELGHAIDSRVNASDALGDEGAIFARFVMGEAPGPAELSALKAENDHAAVDFGSGPVHVELAAPVVGSVTLDGSLAEWKTSEQIDKSNSTTGYDIYARSTGGSLVFALKAPVAIGANTTAWLNTDLNTATGFKIFGSVGGAEYNVNVDAAGTPRLYTGDAGQAPVAGATIPFGYSADKTVLEFAVPTSAVGSPRAVGTLWDVNNATFLPSNFSAAQYELAVPVRTDFTKKVGIVYSDTSANKYFDKMAYSQLFMAAQNQAGMAGVHYDVLTESDLTNLGKLANYDALLFPSFSHVQTSQLSAIESTLRLAAEQYKVGLIASGEFMTYNQTGAALSGDPYARMKSLLGLDIVGGGFPASVTVKAGDITHPMMLDYASNEVIRSYSGVGWLAFAPFGGTAGNVLATQTIGAQTYNAVVATSPGGRNVHFSTDEVMADNNLLWQAIDYAVNGSGISAGLQLSRQASIVASRTDMDQAMEMLDVNPAGNAQGIYDKLMPILQQWKNAYNFVGSYYIDIGNKPAQEQATDWSVSGPYYKQLVAMGNELGSHSLTHPDNTNTLTAAQLQSEFQGSKQIIEQQMSQVLGTAFTVDGAAVPGNPENLPTALSILQYYNYLSGGFSSVGAGYPGAFGYLNPAMASQNKVYLAPNVTFDFSLVEFRGLTAAQAAAAWVAEVAALVKHGEVPVMLWPWHDYGAADWPTNPPADSPYTTAMFTDFISRAYNAGSEFVTLDDLAQRISAFSGSRITTSVSGSTITATVTSADAGKFALDLDNLGTQKIASVAGWYAYDNDSVFLPRAGGSYTIRIGATADDVTRITGLPMRAELLSLSGNGTNLSFSVIGEGDVVIDLKNPAGQSVVVTGATIKSQAGEILTLGLGAIGRHDIAITLGAANQPPAITSNGGGATAAISVAENATAVTTVTATDPNAGQVLTYAITGGADASKFTINAQTGALAFLAARDFEAAADQGGNNVYDVIVAARDSAGASDTQAIAVTVNNVSGLTLTGNTLANTLTGGGEEDTISGLAGNDTLSGAGGNDTLVGGDGDDMLDGGPGMDSMAGGLGNDTYVVDSAADVITENANAGTDTVWSTVNYALGAYVENLVLTGAANLYGTGNALNNVITGSGGHNGLYGGAGIDLLYGGDGHDGLYGDAGNDTLRGEAGYDALYGGDGNDVLYGGTENDDLEGGIGDDVLYGDAGNDRLYGQGGNDTLYAGGGAWTDVLAGGSGDDVYELSNAASQVTELAGEGTDTVRADVAYTIGANVERLVLTGIANLYGTGNALDNVITGSAGHNGLYGGDGVDLIFGGGGHDGLYGEGGNDALHGETGYDALYGGLGHDSLWGGTENDDVYGGDGHDGLYGGSGNDALRGETGYDALFGDDGNDVLYGGTENDDLQGGLGDDVLSGEGGSDRFDYNAIIEGLDTITDFAKGAGGDKLDVKDILVGFTPGTSAIANFVQLAGGASTTVSVNADGTGADFVALAVLQNVAMTPTLLNDLIANGNLVVS